MEEVEKLEEMVDDRKAEIDIFLDVGGFANSLGAGIVFSIKLVSKALADTSKGSVITCHCYHLLCSDLLELVCYLPLEFGLALDS